ncbi:hypothetical protein COF68_06005 [Bacillus toyonensis]|uniref:hypothetical protein n=1 Tax=Bacillus toyonensis TaxID=155322 RepID=UPI000BFC181F|nr:hypothetical protein [Bacillus toyonensis]PHE64389.1 hypothetical protein COF68_06005 [Bacillus toyonensis]
MRKWYLEFLHPEFPDQQLCQKFFNSENETTARTHAENLPYVGLILKLEDRGEAVTEEDELEEE